MFGLVVEERVARLECLEKGSEHMNGSQDRNPLERVTRRQKLRTPSGGHHPMLQPCPDDGSEC